jgi:hypothetical protein
MPPWPLLWLCGSRRSGTCSDAGSLRRQVDDVEGRVGAVGVVVQARADGARVDREPVKRAARSEADPNGCGGEITV